MSVTKEQPPTATATCFMTRKELQDHLTASQHGALTAVFNSYFLPGSMPPRCAACNRLVAEHGETPEVVNATAVVMPSTQQQAFGTALNASVAVSLPVQRRDASTDVIDMPAPRALVFLFWFMTVFGVFVGLVALGLMAAVIFDPKGKPVRGVAFMLSFLSAFYLNFAWWVYKHTRHCEVTVHKDRREVSVSARTLLSRRGQAVVRQVRFDDLDGITVTRPDAMLQAIAINLQLANPAAQDRTICIQQATLLDYQNFVVGWQKYLGQLGVAINAPGAVLPPGVVQGAVVGSPSGSEGLLTPIVGTPLEVEHVDDADIAHPKPLDLYKRTLIMTLFLCAIEICAFGNVPDSGSHAVQGFLLLLGAIAAAYYIYKLEATTVTVLRDFHLVEITTTKTWLKACVQPRKVQIPFARVSDLTVQATTLQCMAHMTIGLALHAPPAAAGGNTAADAALPSFIPLQTVSGPEAQCTLLAWQNFFRPHISATV